MPRVKVVSPDRYFSAWCCQNNEYFHTGRNSLTFRACAESILGYLWTDSEMAGLVNIKRLSDEQIAEEVGAYEVRIHNHKKILTEA